MKWDEKYRDEVEFLATKFFEEDERHRGISGQTVRSVEDVHRRMAWVAIKARHEWDSRMESPQHGTQRPYEGGVCTCGFIKKFHYASVHK